MKKKLNPDTLKVESFHSSAPEPDRGTVYGHSLDPTRCVTCANTNDIQVCGTCSAGVDCPVSFNRSCFEDCG